ncbi:MAG: hypothetical protein AAF487_04830 [Bacteroidota bacterium]
MKTHHSILILVLLVFFSSCLKEENELPNTPDNPLSSNADLYSGQNQNVDLTVRVLDENNQAIMGALVTFGPEQALTDDFGIAQFSQVSADSRRAHVDAIYSGYFTSHRNFNPVAGNNYVTFKMSPRELLGTFNTSSGGVLTHANGASLNFLSGPLQEENGGEYEGTVNVYSAYLNPGSSDFGSTVPGDLMGMLDQETQVLESYGMLGVELESSSGQALNLTEGSEAILTFPLEGALLNAAPNEINLWFYNEESDVWVAEGNAELINNNYVASVSHFTWWNCDIPSNFIDLEFTLLTDEGNLPGANVDFQLCASGITCTGTTNQNGLFEGQVPIDMEMVLKVLNACGEVVLSETIGPFSANTDLGDIILPTLEVGYPIVGTAVDCDGQAISNGYVTLSENGSNFSQVYLLNSDGSFSFPLICLEDPFEYTLLIADTDNLMLSEAFEFTYDDSDINDLGTLSVCDQVLEEYFTLDFNGTNYNAFSESEIYDSGDCWHVSSSYPTNTSPPFIYNSVFLSFENTGSEGLAYECTPDSVGNVILSDFGGNSFVSLLLTSLEVDITNYPSGVGEYLVGTYTANHDGAPQSTIPPGTLSGSFSILND